MKLIIYTIIIFLLAFCLALCLTGEEITSWVNISSTKPFARFLKWWHRVTGRDEIFARKPIKMGIIMPIVTTVIALVIRLVGVPISESGKFVPLVIAFILLLLMIVIAVAWTICAALNVKTIYEFIHSVLLLVLLVSAEWIQLIPGKVFSFLNTIIGGGSVQIIASAWSVAFEGKDFIVSVLRVGPVLLLIFLVTVIIVGCLVRLLVALDNKYTLTKLTKAIFWVLISLFIAGVIAIVIWISATQLKWRTESADSGTTTTTEETTTEPTTTTETKTSVAKDDKKSEPKTEEPKTEEPKAEEPTSGPNFGITSMGVGFNYIEYNDRHEVNGKKFTAKERWNAFGLNREDVVDKKEQREEVKLVAKEMPEVLAAYSVAFFTDEEKKELGIKGKTAKEVDHMFDQAGGGELQEKLYKKLVEIIDSDETQLMDVVVKGWQWSDYLFHKDKDKDGYCTPAEVELCKAKVYRNNQPQLLVQRLINKKWVSFGYLNKKCRYQLSGPDEPKDVPKDPDEPTVPTTPTTPTTPPPEKEHKDPADSKPTTYNQPNVNPTSHSADTNTGEGSTVSSKEPGSQTGSAPGSADFKKAEDYIQYNQNEVKEQLEQQEKNKDGNKSSEEKTEEKKDSSKETKESKEKKEDDSTKVTVFENGKEESKKPVKTTETVTVEGKPVVTNEEDASDGTVTGP